MNDLVQQVRDAIDALEATADGYEWERGHTMECLWWGDQPGYCSCGSADRIRRRCANDRGIVQQHEPDRSDPDELVCGVCIEPGYIGIEGPLDWPVVAYPCPTLRFLAEGYGITVEVPS